MSTLGVLGRKQPSSRNNGLFSSWRPRALRSPWTRVCRHPPSRLVTRWECDPHHFTSLLAPLCRRDPSVPIKHLLVQQPAVVLQGQVPAAWCPLTAWKAASLAERILVSKGGQDEGNSASAQLKSSLSSGWISQRLLHFIHLFYFIITVI